MDYQEFLNYVKDNILSYLDLEEDTQAEIRTYTKNNGLKCNALSIRRVGFSMSPNIYLEPFFAHYQKGIDITEIMEAIADFYNEHADEVDIDVDDIFKLEAIRDHLIIRLVNTESNKEQIERCPHVHFHDMTVMFRWLVSRADVSIGSVLISNREYRQWNINIAELFEIALANTVRIFPGKITQLGNMLVGYLKRAMDGINSSGSDGSALQGVREDLAEYIAGEANQPPLYILTNESGINGASSILYPGVLKAFAESIGKNLYLMPSSIHEFIILPEHETVFIEEMFELVTDANHTVVPKTDVLADSVYYYSLSNNQIIKLAL
ncbi:MAG: hypothetical protein IKQ71_02655 [Lachnospiraceae bacterium]|nr:hypothetical protein [Lachnospiraceae bacterium]